MSITILSLVTFLGSTCLEPKMVNLTKLPWNYADIMHLDIAKKRCGEIYKSSACVIEFRKRTSSDYSVICGKGK